MDKGSSAIKRRSRRLDLAKTSKAEITGKETSKESRKENACVGKSERKPTGLTKAIEN